ncbi:MAG: hypothetical protein LLG09_08420 [Negativicutes bacterium]|nr:hypothetical protein [Negativicutes bacterium]
MKMNFDGAKLFLDWLQGRCELDELLRHPGYQTIFEHNRQFAAGLTPEDIKTAVRQEPSPFFGLRGLQENLPAIKTTLERLESQQESLLKQTAAALQVLFPPEDLGEITVYPVIGYDVGIGLHGQVPMNLNYAGYLKYENEFLYMMMHECFHAAYEKYQPVPDLKAAKTKSQWLQMLAWAVQNEGYATYSSLNARLLAGIEPDESCFTIKDYLVLQNPVQLEQSILSFLQTLESFENSDNRSDEDWIDFIFGQHRYAYRVGCALIRRINQTYGSSAVNEALFLRPEVFYRQYRDLLSEKK